MEITTAKQSNGDVRIRVQVGEKVYGRVCTTPTNTADHIMAVVCAFMHPGQASPLRDKLREEFGKSENPVLIPTPVFNDHGPAPTED
jgi:hypothetical protein